MSSSSSTLGEFFYPLFDRLFSENSDFVAGIKNDLNADRQTVQPELFISKGLGIGLLLGIALWIIGSLIGYGLVTFVIDFSETVFIGLPINNESLVAFINTIKPLLVIGALGVILGSLGFALGFGVFVKRPAFSTSSKEREVEVLLPDVISFMYALSVGGLNQLQIMDAVAEAEDTYGEAALEFRTILRETEYFDTDYQTAIQKRANETPSDNLSQFLTDMLSVLQSGGDFESFLDDKKDKHMRLAKQSQEARLEVLELFGEMFITLSLFPLLLIIILVVMKLLGNASDNLLFGTVYGLIPIISVGFIVLVSTVKQDEIGSGILESGERETGTAGLTDLGVIDSYAGDDPLFDTISTKEATYKAKTILTEPHIFFRDNPLYVLAFTAPLSVVAVAFLFLSASQPLSFDSFTSNMEYWTFTVLFLPIYINGIPLSFFYEWKQRYRNSVLGGLSDALRKLASANESGQSLFEAIQRVAETSGGRLSNEFGVMYAKVKYGMSVSNAFIEFNNKFRVPRLARTVNLVVRAQEASNEITQVLTTAALATESQDDLIREQKAKARMQLVIIVMTFIVLLLVMLILKVKFLSILREISTSSGGASTSGGGESVSLGSNLNVDKLEMLFFHAVALQSVASGMIAGYIRTSKILSGLKIVIVLQTITLGAWVLT